MRLADLENGTIERMPPDDRSAEEIASDIFNIRLEPADVNGHLEFYSAHKDYLKGIGSRCGKRRYNFMIERPVPGAYFG